MYSQHNITTILSKANVFTTRKTKMFDTKGILEILHTSNDINMQVKIISTISACLVSNEVDIDVVITYNALYDKITHVLSNCPPRKLTVTFNFISALLYAVDDDTHRGKSLLVYAKNMIRSSGCLATMCELFTSSMMHQDAWRSLCRCIAETCRGVEANQSYCTHLVPTGVKRCSHMNVEVFLVLQSLLQNHARNIGLFIECRGISLFRRELLQHDVCLQLLATLAQSSSQAAELINNTGICEHLREFLRLYGPQSQLGQWSTIILYYVLGPKASNVPAVNNQENEDVMEKTNTFVDDKPNLQCSTDTTRFFQNVMKEIYHSGPPSDLKYLQGLYPAANLKSQSHTQQVLFQNVIQSNKMFKPKSTLSTLNNFCKPDENMKTNDLSFSFLQNCNKLSATRILDQNTEYFERNNQTKNTRISPDIQESLRKIPSRQNTPELTDFQPKFMSTPKNNTLSNNSLKNYPQNVTQKSISHSILTHRERRRIHKRKILSKPTKIPKRVNQSIENKHRSIGGWFFDAINESCTTLVKTVKNIFKPKTCLEETKTETRMSDKDASSCSYSFTNYMRERDAILKQEDTKKSIDADDFSMEMSNSCNTCNDTVVLKHKLANDEYLKQTVRKLKLGINLYGCDFKKISKQLWPQQTYMTPVVLYNLYRKLLIKRK